VSASELGSQIQSPDLVAFLHGGVGIVVGNCDASLVPALTRGFAARVAPDGKSLAVFVGRPQSAAVLANVRPGGDVAVTLASPMDYRAVQIKGEVDRWQLADAADADWVARYWDLFEVALGHVGIPPEQCLRMHCRDLVRIAVLPRALYRQTPGPSAGDALPRDIPWG
jgi:hypothetical protein